MRSNSSVIRVLLGVLACAQATWACGTGDAHHEDLASTSRQNLRDLRRRDGTKQKIVPVCGTVPPTNGEVRMSMGEVADFYRQVENDNDWKRRLQVGPINIDVNWVVVTDSDGNGNVTQATLKKQMDILNAAYRPDFNFRLTSTQYVSNDTFFSFESTFPDPPSGPELALKSRYRRGGTETLNIYSLEPLYPNPDNDDSPPTLLGYAYFPYPFLNGGVVDGVVVHHETLPGGAFIDFNEGAVSGNLSLCFTCSFWLTFHVSCVDIAA
jgi:hypothetical protein